MASGRSTFDFAGAASLFASPTGFFQDCEKARISTVVEPLVGRATGAPPVKLGGSEGGGGGLYSGGLSHRLSSVI